MPGFGRFGGGEGRIQTALTAPRGPRQQLLICGLKGGESVVKILSCFLSVCLCREAEGRRVPVLGQIMRAVNLATVSKLAIIQRSDLFFSRRRTVQITI